MRLVDDHCSKIRNQVTAAQQQAETFRIWGVHGDGSRGCGFGPSQLDLGALRAYWQLRRNI